MAPRRMAVVLPKRTWAVGRERRVGIVDQVIMDLVQLLQQGFIEWGEQIIHWLSWRGHGPGPTIQRYRR